MQKRLRRFLLGAALLLVSQVSYGVDFWNLYVANKCGEPIRAAFIYYPVEDPSYFFKDGWYEFSVNEERLIGRPAKPEFYIYAETLTRSYGWFGDNISDAYEFRSPTTPGARQSYYYQKNRITFGQGEKRVFELTCPRRYGPGGGIGGGIGGRTRAPRRGGITIR